MCFTFRKEVFLCMKKFEQTIEDWYAVNKRDLPWRDTTDPYRIWISEIILQQTRVQQGYDFFLRFIERFPDIATLADASEDEVLRYWQGLGYYTRARNLHAAAQSIGNVFPKTYEGVRALKGVGDYTAAAICSFAYNQPYAVVDGNVYRVLARYLGIDLPIDSVEGKKYFAQCAQQMLDIAQPALYNQAIMDFGAMQCTPQNPNCLFCPLSSSCVALREGRVEELPVKVHRTKVSNRYFNYFLIRKQGGIYVRKRKGQDIWKGLWELPMLETSKEIPIEEIPAQLNSQLLQFSEQAITVRSLWLRRKHVLSHRQIFADFFEIEIDDPHFVNQDYVLVKQSDLDKYAFPRLITTFFERFL